MRYAAEAVSAAQSLLDALEDGQRERNLSLIGRPLKETRAILRMDSGEGFSFADVQERFVREGARVLRRRLADMVTDGLVLQTKPDGWVVTDEGKRLQTASRASMRRASADRILQEFMTRIQEVDANDTLAFRVETAVLFGSYLSDEPRVGDIDIAIRLRRRFSDEQQQHAVEEAARNAKKGNSRNMVEYLSIPERNVRSMLRAGSSRIDLRDLSELEAVVSESRKRGTPVRTRILVGKWNGTDQTRLT